MTAAKKNLTTKAELKFALAFLKAVGADFHNVYLLTAVAAWMRAESGSHYLGNNPFNIRDSKLAIGYRQTKGNGHFAIFKDLATAAKATASLLLSAKPGDYRGYDVIVRALQRKNDGSAKDMQNQGLDFLVALSISKWNASHYGDAAGTVYDASGKLINHLVQVWATITGTPALPAEKHTELRPGKTKPTAPRDLPPPAYLHSVDFLQPYAARTFYDGRRAEPKVLPGAL